MCIRHSEAQRGAGVSNVHRLTHWLWGCLKLAVPTLVQPDSVVIFSSETRVADVMGNSECSAYRFRLFIPRGPSRSQAQGEIQALFSCHMCFRKITQDPCIYPSKAQRKDIFSLCNMSSSLGLHQHKSSTHCKPGGNKGRIRMYVLLFSVYCSHWFIYKASVSPDCM